MSRAEQIRAECFAEALGGMARKDEARTTSNTTFASRIAARQDSTVPAGVPCFRCGVRGDIGCRHRPALPARSMHRPRNEAFRHG